MPRDSGGTYTLPAGNPVATLTVISSTWANTTLSDISTALTGSLDRSGQGAMLAGLKLFDGVIGAPGLSWGTETTSGMYRNAAGDFRWSISSTELLRLNANLVQISGTAPVVRINEGDAAANNRLWDVIASAEQLAWRALTDALVATNWLTVDRTAGTIDTINFPNGTLQYGGVEVAVRNLIVRSFSGNDSTVATDRGRGVNYTGSGGHTFTMDGDVGINGVMTVMNTGTGTITIATTGTLQWLGGAGSVPTGSRTLAIGGVFYAWDSGSGANWIIWGTGIS